LEHAAYRTRFAEPPEVGWFTLEDHRVELVARGDAPEVTRDSAQLRTDRGSSQEHLLDAHPGPTKQLEFAQVTTMVIAMAKIAAESNPHPCVPGDPHGLTQVRPYL
jgi:hypothetical protein